MAINPLPTNLYSGLAERVNTLPHVQFQTQLMQHKAARDEAIDNYFRKLPDTINDKGVRDNEVPVINKAKNDIQDFYLKNKDAIRNPKIDNGAAQFNLQKMYRDANSVVRLSQNAGKDRLEYGKHLLTPGNEYMRANPNVVQALTDSEYPVNDPRYKPLDMVSLTQIPKPLDQTAYMKGYSGFKMDDGIPQVSPHPTDKYHDVETTPKVLSEPTKQAIYEKSATDYETNPSFKNFIDNTLAKDPDALQRAAKTFEEKMGHPVQSNHDIAAGFAFSSLPQGEVKQKLIDNGLKARERQQAGFSHQELMRNIGLADAKSLIDYRHQAQTAGADANELWVNKYVDGVVQDNKPTGKLFGIIPTTSKDYVPDPVLYKALGNPVKVAITRDGNFDVQYEKKDANGNMVPDPARSKVMKPDEVKLALGAKTVGKKQLPSEMQQAEKIKSTTPATPKKTAKDPLGIF